MPIFFNFLFNTRNRHLSATPTSKLYPFQTPTTLLLVPCSSRGFNNVTNLHSTLTTTPTRACSYSSTNGSYDPCHGPQSPFAATPCLQRIKSSADVMSVFYTEFYLWHALEYSGLDHLVHIHLLIYLFIHRNVVNEWTRWTIDNTS